MDGNSSKWKDAQPPIPSEEAAYPPGVPHRQSSGLVRIRRVFFRVSSVPGLRPIHPRRPGSRIKVAS